jgi:hypothetical protein
MHQGYVQFSHELAVYMESVQLQSKDTVHTYFKDIPQCYVTMNLFASSELIYIYIYIYILVKEKCVRCHDQLLQQFVHAKVSQSCLTLT